MKLEKYFENPQILHVGTTNNRSYFIPYYEDKNDRCIMLSDDNWSFKWYKNYLEVPDNFISGNNKNYDIISVPSCVNILGYEKHQYANVKMPIPFDPPYVPLDNPCGAYIKKFNIDDLNSDYFLNFEGVDSCFYLWVNKKFVGYSQVSHSTSEFDITPFVNKGENFISVLVLKWCDGTYFEDQDKLRMTGIFRDVYILKRPENKIEDYKITTDIDFNEAGNKARVNIEVIKENNLNVLYEIYSPINELIKSFKTTDNINTIEVDKPLLWNSETPYLYTLVMSTEGEKISQKVGIRKIEIKDSVLYLNKKQIKLNGVNRHDSNAFTGYTISRNQLLDDLRLMKEHNVNAIRTSHYPNAPWAYELYSKMGFYVMDEADMETHNTEMIYGGGRVNYNYEDTIIKTRSFGLLCSDKTYEKTILDRIERCVTRDKNQACVIMWSLGNESGFGANMEKAAAYIKSQNKEYLVHYESSIYEMMDHENDLSNIDVYSRMYMPVKECEDYCKSDFKKPLILCEYSHSMGNSCGDLEDYFNVIDNYDKFAGAFVWEWNDHSVYSGKTIDGKDKFLYGGDFKEFPVEGNFCIDGLLYPDRTPHTGLIEYKNVFRPIRITSNGNKLIIKNQMNFNNIKDILDITWTLVEDGKVIKNGMLEQSNIDSRESIIIDFPCEYEINNGNMYFMFRYILKENIQLLKKGYCLGFDQIIISQKENNMNYNNNLEALVSQNDRNIVVSNKDFKYTFDKFTGTISTICVNNTSYLDKPMEYNIWRALADNDRKIAGKWIEAGYDRKTVRVYDSTVLKTNNKIEVVFKIGIGAVFLQNSINMTASFSIYDKGMLNINIKADKNPVFPYLPRFGIRIFIPKTFSNVKYTGYGPYESYVDKKRASYYDTFNTTVSKLHEDYIKPQENGSHCGCSNVVLSNKCNSINVMGKDISFNASYYTQEMLWKTKHNFELVEDNSTILCIDSHMSGLGSGSCGPVLIEKYQVKDNHLEFNTTIEFK